MSSVDVDGEDESVKAFVPNSYERDIDENRSFFMFPFAEFLGSMFLTMFTCGSIVSAGALTYQYELQDLSGGRLLCLALTNGLVYATLIYASISIGQPYMRSVARKQRIKTTRYEYNYPVGHFNPCVTFAVCLFGDIQPAVAAGFFFAQIFGSVAGVLIVYGVVPGASKTNLGATIVGSKSTTYQALGMEAALTFILVFSVLFYMAINSDQGRTVGARKKGPYDKIQTPFSHMAPLLCALVTIACTFVGADVSGASMNPARSFAAAIVSGVWSEHWIYWVGPYSGALLAWFFSFLATRCG